MSQTSYAVLYWAVMKGMQLTIIDLLHSSWKRNSWDFDSRLDGGLSFNKDWLRSGLHGMILEIKAKRLLNDDRQSWYISYIWSLLGDALTKTQRKFSETIQPANMPAVGKVREFLCFRCFTRKTADAPLHWPFGKKTKMIFICGETSNPPTSFAWLTKLSRLKSISGILCSREWCRFEGRLIELWRALRHCFHHRADDGRTCLFDYMLLTTRWWCHRRLHNQSSYRLPSEQLLCSGIAKTMASYGCILEVTLFPLSLMVVDSRVVARLPLTSLILSHNRPSSIISCTFPFPIHGSTVPPNMTSQLSSTIFITDNHHLHSLPLDQCHQRLKEILSIQEMALAIFGWSSNSWISGRLRISTLYCSLVSQVADR